MKIIKDNILVVLSIGVLSIMGFVYFNSTHKSNIVAAVGKSTIEKGEFEKYLLSEYGQDGINKLIGAKVILMESKSKNITATNEEVKAESQNLPDTDKNKSNISIQTNYDYVSSRVKAKKLMKDTIDPMNIANFYNNKNLKSLRIFKTEIYIAKSMDEAMDIARKINSSTMKIDDLTSSLTKIYDKDYKSYEQPYGTDISSAKVGQAFHVMDKDKELILLIKSISNNKQLDLEKDHNEIVNLYLASEENYNSEYDNLIKSLKSKYAVSYSNKLFNQ